MCVDITEQVQLEEEVKRSEVSLNKAHSPCLYTLSYVSPFFR